MKAFSILVSLFVSAAAVVGITSQDAKTPERRVEDGMVASKSNAESENFKRMDLDRRMVTGMFSVSARENQVASNFEQNNGLAPTEQLIQRITALIVIELEAADTNARTVGVDMVGQVYRAIAQIIKGYLKGIARVQGAPAEVNNDLAFIDVVLDAVESIYRTVGTEVGETTIEGIMSGFNDYMNTLGGGNGVSRITNPTPSNGGPVSLLPPAPDPSEIVQHT